MRNVTKLNLFVEPSLNCRATGFGATTQRGKGDCSHTTKLAASVVSAWVTWAWRIWPLLKMAWPVMVEHLA